MTRRKSSRKGIKTTIIVTPRWQRTLQGLKNDARSILAVIGLAWLIYELMKALNGG